jgi:hypothetical protein
MFLKHKVCIIKAVRFVMQEAGDEFNAWLPSNLRTFCCRSSHFQNTNLLSKIKLILILYTLLYYIYILLEIVFGGFIYLVILKVSKKKLFRGKSRWNVEGPSSCGVVMMNIWTMLNSLKYRGNYSCKRNCVYAKVL